MPRPVKRRTRTMNKTRCNDRHTRRTLAVVLTAVLICSMAMSTMAAGLFGSSKEESYRSISVYQFTGTAEVNRDKVGKISAYNNMQLQSNDKVSTGANSELYLKLDSDKYMMAEANTQFDIVAEGTKKNSKTKIVLKSGSIINRIDSKLAEGESYEVSTANSTMAVRGTKFKITVYVDADGVSHTQVSVYDGTVQTRLAHSDGTYADPVDVGAGYQVNIISSSDGNSYYTATDNTIINNNYNINNILTPLAINTIDNNESDFLNNEINYVNFKELFNEFVISTVSDVNNTISDISNIITNNTPVMIKADPSAADDNSSSDSTEDKSSNQTEAQQSETSSQADETETEKESESAKESESEKESESVTETETETEAETEKESSDSDKDIPEDEGTESETKEGTDTDTETETDTETDTDTDTDTETESLGSDDDIPEDKEQIAPEETDS